MRQTTITGGICGLLLMFATVVGAEMFESATGNDYGGQTKIWSYDENDPQYVQGIVQVMHYYDARNRLREKKVWSTAARIETVGIAVVQGLYDTSERMVSVADVYAPEWAQRHGVVKVVTTFNSREKAATRTTWYTAQYGAQIGCLRQVEHLNAAGRVVKTVCFGSIPGQ